jgi:hypothetical protein
MLAYYAQTWALAKGNASEIQTMDMNVGFEVPTAVGCGQGVISQKIELFSGHKIF